MKENVFVRLNNWLNKFEKPFMTICNYGMMFCAVVMVLCFLALAVLFVLHLFGVF